MAFGNLGRAIGGMMGGGMRRPPMNQPPPRQTSFGGFGRPPQQMNKGVGPSNPMMNKLAMAGGAFGGMMGGRNMARPSVPQGPPPMNDVPMGNVNTQPTYESPAASRTAGEAAGNDMSWMDQPGAVQTGPSMDRAQQIQATQGDLYRPDVMPQAPAEEPIGQMNQGIGPRPSVFGRMAQRARPRMY